MSQRRSVTSSLRALIENLLANALWSLLLAAGLGAVALSVLRWAGSAAFFDFAIRLLLGIAAIVILVLGVMGARFIRTFNFRERVDEALWEILTEGMRDYRDRDIRGFTTTTSGALSLGVRVEHYSRLPTKLLAQSYVPDQFLVLGHVSLMSLLLTSAGNAVFDEVSSRLRMLPVSAPYQGAILRGLGRQPHSGGDISTSNLQTTNSS